MIGIIGAMKIEIDGLKDMMTDKKTETVSGVEYCCGKLHGKDVVVAVCGIGKVFAAICAEAMIIKYGVDAVINTGVGGSLNEELKIGDILVAEKVCQHDMDTSPIGDPKGLLSGINQIYLSCDEKYAALLAEAAGRAGVTYKRGTVATGDQFVNSAEVKDRIVSEFGADVCEMEGGSIGHVCYVNNVPFGIIRAISDGEGAEMDYMTFAPLAAKQSVVIVKKFINIF